MSTQTPTQEQIRNAWDGIADGFDRHVTPHNFQLAEDALRLAGLSAGTRFLDVAAGSGALSIPAARLGSQVVATDIAPTMIERLRARARAEGLDTVDARVMDGQALDLNDNTFDVSGSQHGVSLFPDLSRGLAEMVRVTKPGGRVLIVAFGALQKAEFLGLFIGAMRATVPGFTPLPVDPPPLPFQVADPDVLRNRLMAAGLVNVQVKTVTSATRFDSVAQYWDMVTSSNPIGRRLAAQATADQQDDVRRILDGMFRERSNGESRATLHTEINIGTGNK